MRRRDFITFLGGAAGMPVACCLAAQAQQKLPVIGLLSGESRLLWQREFRQGLSEAGFFEGRNVTVEYRFANGADGRLPVLATELLARGAGVIVAAGMPAMRAARSANQTIPIVFAMSGDPVKLGIVSSLNRPDGNLTGATTLGVEVGPKRLELLCELIPAATLIAALVNPHNPGAEVQSTQLQNAARKLGVGLRILHATNPADIDKAFTNLSSPRIDGVVVGTNALFTAQTERLATLAARHAIPTIFQNREFAAAGGLISYGGGNSNMYRLAGAYAGRILKGERTADLPVQQATKIELIINLKTAKALGLTIPITVLGRADEVIE